MEYNKIPLILVFLNSSQQLVAQRNYFLGYSYVFGHSHTPRIEGNTPAELAAAWEDGRAVKSISLSFGFSSKRNSNRRYIFSSFRRHLDRNVSVTIKGFNTPGLLPTSEQYDQK